MKINAQEKYKVEASGDAAKRVAVVIHNVGHHMRVLAESTYSRPIEAVVRETIANGIDASRGKQFDVTVPSLLDPNFKVRDYGVGMTEEFFTTGYARVGFSTKRDSNDEIGGFGQGRFAAFAYQGCDQFYVRGVKDGEFFLGSVSRNADFEIFVEVEDQGKTDEPNGCEVIIPVKVEHHAQFKKAIQIFTEFLDPPANVAVEPLKRPALFEASDHSWKISAFDDSEGEFEGEPLRAIMGGIPYKLDKNQVFPGYSYGTETMAIKAADLHFPIGALSVPASREELRYDDETKRAIKVKFAEIRKQIEAHIAKIEATLQTDWERWTNKSVLSYKKALGKAGEKYLKAKDITHVTLMHDFKRLLEFSGRSTKVESTLQVSHERTYLFYLVDDPKQWRRRVGIDACMKVAALPPMNNHYGNDVPAKGWIVVVDDVTAIPKLGDPPYIKVSTLPMPPKMPRIAPAPGAAPQPVTKHVPYVMTWEESNTRWVENTTPDWTVKGQVYVPFAISLVKDEFKSKIERLTSFDVMKKFVGVPQADIKLAEAAGWIPFDKWIDSHVTPDSIEGIKYDRNTSLTAWGHHGNRSAMIELGWLIRKGFNLPQPFREFQKKIKLYSPFGLEDGSNWLERLPLLTDKIPGHQADKAYDLTIELITLEKAHPFFYHMLQQDVFSDALKHQKVDVPTLLAAAKRAL